jgi:hypothetical protein
MIALKSFRIKRNVLLGYWILVPSLFYFYLFLISFHQQLSIQELITQIPGLALAFLVSFVTLFQAACLYFIGHEKANSGNLEKQFLTFSMVQQILTGNIIGARLCYFYNKQLFSGEENPSQRTKLLFYSIVGFVSLISLVILMIAIRMRGVHV